MNTLLRSHNTFPFIYDHTSQMIPFSGMELDARIDYIDCTKSFLSKQDFFHAIHYICSKLCSVLEQSSSLRSRFIHGQHYVNPHR